MGIPLTSIQQDHVKVIQKYNIQLKRKGIIESISSEQDPKLEDGIASKVEDLPYIDERKNPSLQQYHVPNSSIIKT